MRRLLSWFMRGAFGVDLDEGVRWRRDALLRDGWNTYIKCTTWSLGGAGMHAARPFTRDDH